jgi:hypothetical protein
VDGEWAEGTVVEAPDVRLRSRDDQSFVVFADGGDVELTEVAVSCVVGEFVVFQTGQARGGADRR